MEVIQVPQLYATVKEIAKIFSIGEFTARQLIHEMARSKYKPGVVCYGRMLRVKISEFEKFFQSKSY